MGTNREFSALPRMGENCERDLTEEMAFELTMEGWKITRGARTMLGEGMCTKAWEHTTHGVFGN